MLKSNFSLQKTFLSLMILSMFLFLFIFIAIPIIKLLLTSLSDPQGSFVGFENFKEYFRQGEFRTSLVNSLIVSFSSSIISITLALGFAFATTRTNIKFKAVLKSIAMIPLFAPTMLYGISLIYLFGNQGIFTKFFSDSFSIYGLWGIIIAESFYIFPHLFLILYVSLRSYDSSLYEAADMMNARGMKKFIKITLPSIKYGLITAFFVGFTLSLTDFGAPKIIGGRTNVLATEVSKYILGQQNFQIGAVASLFLLIPAGLSFFIENLASKRQKAFYSHGSKNFELRKNKFRFVFFTIFAVFISVIIIGFLSVSIFASVTTLWPYNLKLTLSNYDFSRFNMGGFNVWKTIIVALVSAFFGSIICFTNAYLIQKEKALLPFQKASRLLSMIPMALPGLVLGISYILFFNSPTLSIPFTNIKIPNALAFLYGTPVIIVIANIVHFYSVPYLTSTSALKKIDSNFQAAAQTMNASKLTVFFKVFIPISLPSLLEIFVYFFTNSMVTISAVIFLYTANFKPMSVAIIGMEESGNIAVAAALSVSIVFINIFARLIYIGLTRLLNIKRKKWDKF